MTYFVKTRFSMLIAFAALFGASGAAAHGDGITPGDAYAPPSIDLQPRSGDRYCWTVNGSSTCGPCAVAFGVDEVPSLYTCTPAPSRLNGAPQLTPVQGTVTLALDTTRYVQDWAGNLIAVPHQVLRSVPATVYVVSPPVVFSAPATVGYSPALYSLSSLDLCRIQGRNSEFYARREYMEFYYSGYNLLCYSTTGHPNVVPARFTTTLPSGR